jgi:hypothetical protein
MKASGPVLLQLFLIEEFAVTFEYLSGMKNMGTVVGALSCLEIDGLKNQDQKTKNEELSTDQKTTASVTSNQ